jgi:zinc protease
MLYARRAGGYSLYPPSDLFNAKYAGSIVQAAGFGSFDQTRLQKALSGTIANVNLNISLYSETVSASTSPKDMELMFQMLYQYVHAPRKDQSSFDSFISRSKAMLENKMLSPEEVFRDSVTTFFYNNHPYYVPESVEGLMSISQDRVYEIYQQRFGDFSGFDFVIVGNFDEAQLKDMCETYLANLPSPKKPGKAAYRNVHKAPAKGFREKTIYMGQDQKSTVMARIVGNHKFSNQEKLNLDALMMIANERLRESIREEHSGVYVVAAFNSFSKHPVSEYTVNLYMMCSPDRYEELYNEALKVLDELKTGVITDEEAAFVRTTLQRNYEQSIINNRYWVTNLDSNLWNGEDLTFFLKYPELYVKITPSSLQKSARKYLTHDKGILRAVLLPLGD